MRISHTLFLRMHIHVTVFRVNITVTTCSVSTRVVNILRLVKLHVSWDTVTSRAKKYPLHIIYIYNRSTIRGGHLVCAVFPLVAYLKLLKRVIVKICAETGKL